VPSLRDVALTAPYMHDGRFATLAQVINHYRNPGPGSAMIEFRPYFDMTPQHIEALVAFLETLSGSVDASAAGRSPDFCVGRVRSALSSPVLRLSALPPMMHKQYSGYQ
jgi:cytochrome c peroxidase